MQEAPEKPAFNNIIEYHLHIESGAHGEQEGTRNGPLGGLTRGAHEEEASPGTAEKDEINQSTAPSLVPTNFFTQSIKISWLCVECWAKVKRGFYLFVR